MADNKKPDDMFTHAPLPYRVVLRATVTKDSPPMLIEKSVVAYSVFEAVMQVLMETGGNTALDMKYAVEKLEPDVPAYWLMLAAHALQEKEARR